MALYLYKKSSGIEKKLKSIRHHIEYDNNPLGIENKMKNHEILYDHSKDKKNQSKWLTDKKLKILDTNKLPSFLEKNKSKYSEWFVD